MAGLVLGAGALAVACRPRMAEIRRSFHTSSSPAAATYDVLAGLVLGGYYDDIAADCAVTLAGVDAPAILEVGPGPGHLAEHWPDAAAGFRGIRRVLRPGATALVFDLPEAWGHVETGFAGIGAASTAFQDPELSRMRGLGPWTLVRRVELRRPADDQ